MKSSYLHYIKFPQKSTNSTRDKNVGILDKEIMGLKDRVNFGSLRFIKTHKITKLQLKEGMNRNTVKVYFFSKSYICADSKNCLFYENLSLSSRPIISLSKMPTILSLVLLADFWRNFM